MSDALPLTLPPLPEPIRNELHPDHYTADQLRSYAEQAVAARWREIETAPKDGTHIWAAQAGTPDSGEVFWDTELSRWASLSEDCYEPNWEPTHWMPLPNPPALSGVPPL